MTARLAQRRSCCTFWPNNSRESPASISAPPQDGHARRRDDVAVRAPRRVRVDRPDDLRDASLAFCTRTRSPTRMSRSAITASLANDARLTTGPPSDTGASDATGATLPVLPTCQCVRDHRQCRVGGRRRSRRSRPARARRLRGCRHGDRRRAADHGPATRTPRPRRRLDGGKPPRAGGTPGARGRGARTDLTLHPGVRLHRSRAVSASASRSAATVTGRGPPRATKAVRSPAPCAPTTSQSWAATSQVSCAVPLSCSSA